MNDRQYKDEDTSLVKADNKVAQYSSSEIQLIHDTYAKGTTKEEFELYLYTANKFQLDPLLKQIWCVKFANQNAQIYAGRDGFLQIAHRSGQFNGIESGMKDDRTAYAKVYRKDMDNPFYVEVDMAEYSTGQALWKSKPRTMLIKVAESQALRRAFSISNIYGEEEMGQWELQAQGIKFEPNVPQALPQAPQQQQSNDYGLDPDTYIINFGNKFKGKKLIDTSSSYIQWMIDQSKISTYKQTKDGIPMNIWIEFLEVCLKIHQQNKENPQEFADIKQATPQEIEPDLIENFEKEIDTDELILNQFPGSHEIGKGKEAADKVMAKLKGK